MKTLLLFFVVSFNGIAHEHNTSPSKFPRNYVMMKHGKLIEVKNGHKTPVKKDITLLNESTIHPGGMINVSSGETRQLKEGEYMTMDGRIRLLKDMHY